ncbi:hypothetical protein BIV25_16420 [Streptomyces sp. MUSC 14]|uniref:tyrosine-type recombinase/integrase n=1 Tax=Streptomyces sp. MUSC 14 TaxID=1354889 RepID=UPI0008F55A80|nr:tyrosine-type recombinase/integrase [Streptomyces sp. MUSC 14]OIJ96918.1 hypothetical protein BIV25_16420 [Streptomyces sp. MUSC 14]
MLLVESVLCLPLGALASAGLIGKADPDSDGSKWEPSHELDFHALRRTCAGVRLEAGESIDSLARWLGHADPGSTLRTYTHVTPDAGTRGRAAMDAWFRGEANSLETP